MFCSIRSFHCLPRPAMAAAILFQSFLACLVFLGNAHSLSIRNTINNNGNNGELHGNSWNIHVTIHVYSGRQDPTWYIPDSHPSYHVILKNMNSIPLKPLPTKLGYKGFSLVHLPPGAQVSVGGHFNQTVTSLPEWEMYLLQTAAGIEDGVMNHAKQTILNSKTKRRRRSDPLTYQSLSDYDLNSLYGSLYNPTPKIDTLDLLDDNDMYRLAKIWGLDKRFKNITTTPSPVGPTKYEPEKWNKYFVKEHNNCYNYANDRITDTFAQPGRAGGCALSTYMTHGDLVRKVANCDGLEDVSAPSLHALPQHSLNLVALVFWPPEPGSKEFDFHWYRLDGNGRWSHKPGKTSATNVDQSGKLILDPRHADRGPYTEFVGFLQTRQDKVILI